MLRRRMLLMLSISLTLILLLGGYKAYSNYQANQQHSAPRAPISVSAEPAQAKPWQAQLVTVGSLTAAQGVELTTEARGTVSEVLFESGQQVSQGQPLVQLNNQVEQAVLATAEASLGLAKLEFKRAQDLVKRQALAKSEFDRLAAELHKTQAQVDQLKALLARKRIVAPFAGTMGIRRVDVGSYLSTDDSFATLQDLSSLYLDFFLPEQNLAQLSIGQRVLLNSPAYPEETFSAELVAISPKVESATRNVQLRAKLANPQGKLLPGMFAGLAVLIGEPTEQIVVPETAITFTLYGNSVFVANPQLDTNGEPVKTAKGQAQWQAQRRFVETGEQRDGQVVIHKGLKAGEQVVTAGQLKLSNDDLIILVADQALQPKPLGQ